MTEWLNLSQKSHLTLGLEEEEGEAEKEALRAEYVEISKLDLGFLCVSSVLKAA